MLRLKVEKFTISRIERGIGFHSRGRAYDKAHLSYVLDWGRLLQIVRHPQLIL